MSNEQWATVELYGSNEPKGKIKGGKVKQNPSCIEKCGKAKQNRNCIVSKCVGDGYNVIM
jgi:hypothetical protein